jgi:hypothetical protein
LIMAFVEHETDPTLIIAFSALAEITLCSASPDPVVDFPDLAYVFAPP